MDRKVLFLSIEERYARAIIEGRKKAEIRRMKPSARGGDRTLIYMPSPRCELVATAVIDHVTYGSHDEIAEIAVASGALSRHEYEQYARGKDTMVAIWLRDAAVLDRALTLNELRAAWPGFHPPQQYGYRSHEEIEALERPAGMRFWTTAPGAL